MALDLDAHTTPTTEQLKDELAARGMPRSGPKAMLQRKLHAALVLAAQPEAMDT